MTGWKVNHLHRTRPLWICFVVTLFNRSAGGAWRQLQSITPLLHLMMTYIFGAEVPLGSIFSIQESVAPEQLVDVGGREMVEYQHHFPAMYDE